MRAKVSSPFAVMHNGLRQSEDTKEYGGMDAVIVRLTSLQWEINAGCDAAK